MSHVHLSQDERSVPSPPPLGEEVQRRATGGCGGLSQEAFADGERSGESLAELLLPWFLSAAFLLVLVDPVGVGHLPVMVAVFRFR